MEIPQAEGFSQQFLGEIKKRLIRSINLITFLLTLILFFLFKSVHSVPSYLSLNVTLS